MSMNKAKVNRMTWKALLGAWMLAAGLPLAAQADWGDTCYWKSGSANGNWDNTFWYNTTRSWDNHNPGYVGGQDLRFDNGSNLDMTNNWSGAGTNMWRITFVSGTGARTIYGTTQNTFRNNGTPKIENNDADAMGVHFPFRLDTGMEINPVSGNLTLNGAINNNGYWIDVYGANQKTLTIGGVLSGSGGIAVKQDSIVVLTNDNSFSGAIWVEKGTVQLNNHTNAIGASTIVNVGTNATLDLQYGAVGVRPATLNLYGTGTNSTWGALRKTTSGATDWRGGIALGADSRIVVGGGGLGLYGTNALGSYTLYLSNSAAVTMYSGSTITGTKTTGDGAIRKSGSGAFHLRQGSGLTGTIYLDQGEVRQYGDNNSTLPSGGLLVMSNSTTWRSDTTTARTNAKATRIDGDVTLGYAGGGRVTFSGDVDLNAGARSVSAANDVTISGAVTNGALTKAGTGTMILLGANTAGGTVSAGVLQIGSNGTAGSVSGNLTNNAALTFHRSDASTYSNAISGTGALTNLAGTLTLSGTNTLSGATRVAGGMVVVSGSLSSSAVTVDSGATLAGAGTVGGLTANGTVSPGNATNNSANLACGALTLGSGGSYIFNIANAAGAAGTDWDKITGGGTLTVNGSGTFTISVNGAATGFSSSTSYSWPIMSGTSVSGFDSARFAVNTNNFSAPTAGGTFSVAQSSTNIQLVFTPAAPPTPTGLAASDGTSTAHVALSWNDVAGETGYVIWRHTADVGGSATAIYTNAANVVTYNDTAPTAGTVYYYWVSATNAAGSSAKSSSNSGYKRLSAPANVAATDGSSTANVTVTWDAVTGANTYHVYRDTDSDPAGATGLGPQSSGYADTPTPGTLYYYWVLASNSATASTSDWSTANSGYRKLPVVAGVSATSNLTDRVTVSWTDSNNGETGYTVWRHTADASGSATLISGAALGANAVSYDDTTAVAGTPYWYWVRATNSTSTSQSDFSTSFGGLRQLTEPSTAASVITFASVATTSMTVGWTRGNGDYVLVVAKQGSAPTDPSDSTAYTANAAFGSGDQTAAGSYVVYSGTGTSVPVTGLSVGTEYYFAVYEFNGVATPNYRTSDEPVSSKYTLAAEPTTQATSIIVTGTNEVTLTGINWTDGNGASRLVVVKAGSAVDSFPVDGATYTANAAFGSGTQIGTGNYVVHAGSGPLATLSGLSRDTTYHIRVFEYNGTLGTTVNFLTNSASGNPVSKITMAANPSSAAADLAITAIGTNQFTITWTKGSTGTNTLILVKTSGISTDPSDLISYTANTAFGSGTAIDGGYVVYTGSGSSVTVTALTPGARYYVRAYAFNGSGGSENYRTSDEPSTDGYTLMGEPSQATSLAFGSLGSTSYAVSFTAGNGLSRLVVAKAGGAVDWLPTDGTAYAGENNAFGSGTELSAGNFLVHRGTSPFTLSGLTATTDYHIRIFEYQGTNTTLNYNTNAASGNPSNRYALSTEPSAHGTLAATALSDTQVRLDWGDATGESGYIIVRKSGSAPTGTPADGTQYAQGNAIGDGTVVYVTTAAGAGSVTDSYSTAAATAYYYQIFAVADDGTPAHATYNYRTTATVPGANATTGSSEPATSSTLSSFVQASSTSATIAWTNTGSADGTIILVKSGGAVSSNPSDWTGYTANTAFGSGDQIGTGNYVVYAAGGKYGSVTVSGLSAGTTYHVAVYPYNGSGAFPNYKTSSPATGSLAILPAPTAQSATADGKTLIDLAWTKNASYNVMIVYKSGSAPTDPTQGQAYSVGDACGGGVVIYKGGGAALEHIVAAGTTHHYAFYSYNGNYYSAGVTDSETMTSFASGEIVETFSYTNSTALTGLNGSNGWGGPWYGDTTLFTNSSGSFTTQTNYPATSGNKLWVSPVNDANVAVYRPLGQSYNSGRLYFGYILNYQYEGSEKYEGLSFYSSNTSEKLFFGEIGNQDQQLGIDSTGSAYTLTKGSGNDYIIVGYYDWGTAEAKAKAFKIGTAAVPTDEPSSWDVTVSKASNTVGTVNTIRLAAGEYGGGSGTPGNCYFDEVRISTNWAGLIGVVPSKPADPSGQSATADGNEMARLAWTLNGSGNGVLILHKTTAIGTDPTDGSGYSVGSTIGGATVIYKGTGTKVEHVVTHGTTNFYKFYSYSGSDYYSTGVVATVTNGSYASYERVNPFSYTNAATLGSSQIGGQGFGANFWSVDSGAWTVQTNYSTAVADSVPKFVNMSNYPAMAGNLVFAADPGNGGNARAQRSLSSAISTGTFYVAFMMSYQYRGANKWAGLSLFNGSTEKAFFGKGAGGNWSTLGIGDGSTTYWSAYDMGEFYTGTGNSGNVYLVVGKYDFSTKQLGAKAYRMVDGHTFPETEPSWDVTTTLGTGIDSIDRIKLNIGSSDGGATIGKVFFDEIRYATNWSGLIAVSCPTWAGSNTLNAAAWTAPAAGWLGDTENFQFQSYPVGLGQSGTIEFDWARTGAFGTSYPMTWWQNANNNSYWTNQVQLTTAGVITSRYAAAGSSCGTVYTNNRALTVSNLVAPSGATAVQDGVNTNSQINLNWTRGVSGTAKDTLIVRQTADSGWTAPVNGTTYNPGDSLGSGTVVYRGAGTSHNDTGLAPSTTYYYRFYAENWTYYSTSYAADNDPTAAGGQNISIDGSAADWVGSASAVLDNSASSLQEFIWTDKRGELRTDHADHPNGDLQEFRVFADATWVYFLVRMTNITDATKPFVAIGVDTRTNSASTAMNWIGDDSGTFIGDGYAQGGAAHFPEYQLNIHHVSAAGGARIETYVHNGTAWYAPPTGGNTNVAISAANDVIELKVARADLGLSGATTGRFTVAAFLNTGVWNNDGDGTTHIADNTAAAVDAMSIPPWGVADNAADLSAWLEDISDADIDFWADVKFTTTGLANNSKPSTPVLVTPTNAAAVTASPNLSWQASTDSDGRITGYLLEISTNDQFNGVSGTENGPVDLRVHLYATTTNYTFTTSATQYWWRVRARDSAGELSTATTRYFRVVGKLDTEGPRPTLLYIGTNVAGYLAGDYDAHIAQYGPIQSVLDSELRNTNNVFGFVLRWEDATGVYATNKARATDSPPMGAGGFAFNIVSTDGRVSPNWDIVEYTEGVLTKDWAKDAVFYATNTMAGGNDDKIMTNYVHVAFSMTNYNPSIDYYLTVSAEDAYSDGGSWWTYGSWPSFTNSGAALPYYSGWCEDGPNTARNITTNYLIEIHVVDDDIIAPEASTGLTWANDASLVVSNAAGALAYVSGTGQDVLYQVTDGALIGEPLSFSFNAYDSYYQGVALGTNTTYTDLGRTLTNTAFVAAYWQTNWVGYNASRSVTTDTRNANTMITWHWPSITTQDVTSLWGPDGLSGPLGVTNLIQLDLYDVDNDRTGDQANARVNFGRIQLVDDDATNPVVEPASLQVVGTGLAREYALTNLVEWLFTGTGSARLTAANAIVPADMVSGDLTNDTGAITGTDVITVSAGFATGASRSWIITLAPASTTKTFKAISMGFDSRVSSLNGPDVVEIWGTMPGGSETLWATNAIDLSDSENPLGTNWNSYSVALAMPAATTGTVTFRLKAYVTDTNHLTGTGTATWSLDNLIVSGYILGPAGGTQITDRDLAAGTVQFSLQASDVYSGIDGTIGSTTGRAPRVDFWNVASNVVPVTNAYITNGWSAATNTTLSLSGAAPAAADKKQIALGAGGASLTYYARFTATDRDVDRDGDWRSSTNVTTNTVYDNDSSRPARGYLYGGPLGIFVNGALTKGVASGNSREYRINDEQLQAVAATSITVKVNLYDYSGWTVPVLAFSNASAGDLATNGWLTALNTTGVNTTNLPDAAMEWTFADTQANTLFASYESVTNEFRIVSVWDKDNDRLDAGNNNLDNLELTNARLGYVTFIDNDTGQANVQSNWSTARTNWSIPKVYLGLPGDAASSNLLINGDTVLADTNSGAVLSSLTNRVYDSQLAKASAAAPLSVVLPIFDTGGGGAGRTVKGVQRGTTLTEASTNGGAHTITNTWINIGTVKVQNASAYRSDLSSSLAKTRIAAQFPTSTWTFTAFSYAEVGTWLPAAAAASNQFLTAGIYDADDNRTGDQKYREVPFGTLRVLDNDTVAPSLPTNLKVNGTAAATWTRQTAPWTNQPEFRLSFEPSVDGEPAGTDLEKTGVGEHRVATDKADIGPDLGLPLAVPAESSLANYGFENGATNWTLVGAAVTTNQAYEGLRSVQMTNTSARQTVELLNTNGYAPRVTVSGVQFMGAITGTVTVAGLNPNGTTNSSFQVSIVGTNGQWVAGSAGAQTLAAAVDAIEVTLFGVGYWDDVRVQIEMLNGGTPVDEVASLFTAIEQGLTTNYLFAVDRDNNRAGDRKASSAPADAYIPSFGTAYDITPPTDVPVTAAATENVPDPTTQFDVTWSTTAVGPDDEAHGNYPAGYTGNDVLSPWRSYKIYYGTFNALEVPGGDPGPGNGSAYIYTNFIATGAYSNWPAVSATNAIVDPSASGTNYLALTNLSQGSIRLYDLDYDQDYAIIVVGLDRAGNEGPATPDSWATNNTIKFAVTQGLMKARAFVQSAFPTNNNLEPGDKGAAALYWIAAGATNAQGGYTNVTKDYDLIYCDDASFQENTNWTWQKVGTIRSNWFTDASGLDRSRGIVRFYRASYKDRWQKTRLDGTNVVPQRPLASEEVYAMHNVILSEGYNYVGLHGVPYTNTFQAVFGTDTNFWPRGSSPATGATKVEFYSAGISAPASDVYFFGTDANWYRSGNPTPVTTTVQSNGFFSRGFSITLPSPLPTNFVTTTATDVSQPGSNLNAMVWAPILQVPTNGFSHVISTGGKSGRNVTNVYNVVALNLPVAVHPSQLNLPTNFTRGNPNSGDDIYTINTSTKGLLSSSTIYCDTNGVWKFNTGGGLVPAGYFKPNDVIVIVSRNGGLGNSWTWTYHPTNFYNLPTRWMGN